MPYSPAIGYFNIGHSPIGGGIPPTPPAIGVLGLPFTTSWPGFLQNTIPSYLFVEYNDDANLQAFRDAYNQLQQQYVNWWNQAPLAVYTGPLIVGSLLDWVGQGVYGIERPALPAGVDQIEWALGTWALGEKPLASRVVIASAVYYAVNDDYYKRIITWAFYKGDGHQFSINWLKRRVVRFLLGMNGIAPTIDNTYDISVAISGATLTITIHNSASYSAAAIFQAAVRVGFGRPAAKLSFGPACGRLPALSGAVKRRRGYPNARR